MIYDYFHIFKMERQVKKCEHFQQLLRFAFNQCSKTAKTARDIYAVNREHSMAKKKLLVIGMPIK